MTFSTKAGTLERLARVVEAAQVLPQLCFSVAAWRGERNKVLASLDGVEWSNESVIVRSSAQSEDDAGESQAGQFLSVGDVLGRDAMAAAIDSVIDSFGEASADDHVFVQPYLQDVAVSGVVFTNDPNTGAPYFVVNYNDADADTTGVTGGASNDLKTFVMAKSAAEGLAADLADVISLSRELESLFGQDSLDIEFARATDGTLFLLQVRPLPVKRTATSATDDHGVRLSLIEHKIEQLNRPHPYLLGSRTLFGNMPDWNPAEIIGVRPRPLALSLYKELACP